MAATIKLAPDLTICLRPLNGEATDDLTPELTVKDRHLSREISLEPSRSIALFVDIGDYFDMRSAEGAMILVDIVPDMPASRGVRNRQAYWISKEAAEGTHEIKWFKMWKTKDLDPKDFVLGRRLVMPGYQPVRPTRSTALGSADRSMVSHYSIRVSVTLGKLQDESIRRAAMPRRLDTEPAKPENYSFNSALEVIRPEWFKTLSGKAGMPFTIDFINTAPWDSPSSHGSGRRQSTRVRVQRPLFLNGFVSSALIPNTSDESEEDVDDVDDEEPVLPVKQSPNHEAATSMRKLLDTKRQDTNGGVSRGRNLQQQRPGITAPNEDIGDAQAPRSASHAHRDIAVADSSPDSMPVRKRQRRNHQGKFVSNASPTPRALRSRAHKIAQAPTPPLEPTNSCQSVTSTRSTVASNHPLHQQQTFPNKPTIKLEPTPPPTRPAQPSRNWQAKIDDENEEYALLQAKTRAALMKAEAAEMEAQLAQATLERKKRKRGAGVVDLTED